MNQFVPKPIATVLFILLVTLSLCQLAPQFTITNNTVGLSTSYKMSFYSNNVFTTATTFTVIFNQSYIRVADGNNNCTIKIGGNAVSTPYCICSNRVCTFKPMVQQTAQPIEIQIGNITNPLFTFQQIIQVNIYFTPSVSNNYTITIPLSAYQPMSMIVNSLNQTDYGVGYTPVTYVFNISLYYISRNMQLQVYIPPQIVYSTNLQTSLSFYNTVQNIAPYQFQSLLVFSLQVQPATNPSGFMLLTLNGLTNPRFLGNSSSFKITFVQTNSQSSCSNCKIAQITTGLSIQSKNPGDLTSLSISSDNQIISSVTTLSINLLFYAVVPAGGKVSIYLPPEIVPVIPIVCGNIFGYVITDNNSPTCTYDSTLRRIDTVNFATTDFDSTGNGILSLRVTNPRDSRKVSFKFQTYDSSGRMIGLSRSNYFYSANPIPLNISINKTSAEVDKPFNLNCSIVLSQNLSTSLNFVQLIFPSVSYNLSNIVCTSSGQNLNCNKTIDPTTQQLVISFPPPCVQCSANSTLRFQVLNLKNPAYINDDNQKVIVNTRSTQGIIESSTNSISLQPTSINLLDYQKPVNQMVGTQYNLQLSLNIPDYVKTNGGQIILVFTPRSVYSDGQLSGFNYVGPSSSLQIVASNNTRILSNIVQYDPDIVPNTISRITFNICDGSISICSPSDTNFTFIIRRLKIGYIPSQTTKDIIRISTIFGEIIAEKNMDTSLFSPILNTGPLNMSVSRSITNSFSDFQFGFSSSEVVFDQTIVFSLPASLIINGQCAFSSNQGFISSYVCTKTSSNSISITSSFDQNLMISQTISYTISLTNVTTPVSMAPLNYILQTTYNGTRNQRFTSRYAMQSPSALNLTYTKSNYTINQQFKLSITINPVTTQYDSYELILAKNTIITQQDWVPLFTLTQNTTHYILSRIGTMDNNYTEIRAKNSLSTYEQPQYTINLLQSGFYVQQTVISPPNNDPVVLGCTVALSNRTVNFMTNITVSCDRNNNGQLNDQNLIVVLPTNSFNYSSATYNSTPLAGVPTLTIPISPSSPRIITFTIQSLKNLNYIPNLSSTSSYPSNTISNIMITSIQNNMTKVIGRATVNAANFVPNDGYDIKGVSAVRASTKSGDYTNLTIAYPTILGTTQHLMHITMPAGQNGFTNLTTCTVGATQDPCNITEWNSTDMKIALRPNSTVYLNRVMNYYPNNNLLKIRILTQPQLQLVQQSWTQITPSISLQKLLLSCTASSPKVSSPSTLTLTIRPQSLKIESTNIIQIIPPAKMYTRAFNTDDCLVQPSLSPTTYTGCTYQYDLDGWLTEIRLSSFGPLDVEIGGSIIVGVGVTNGWTSYAFANQVFLVTVYRSEGSASSQGSVSLTQIYSNFASFVPLPVYQSQSSLTQSSITAASANTLSLTLSVNGNIGKNTRLTCMLPKDSYIYTASPNITFQRQDPSYFYISLPTSCQTAGCQNYSQQFTIPVQNNYYIKKQRNNIMVYLQYDRLPASESYVVTVDAQRPLSLPSLAVNRSNSVGSADTQINIEFGLVLNGTYSLAGIFMFGQVTVDISSNITNQKHPQTSYTYSQKSLTTTQPSEVTGTLISKNNQNITITIPSNASNISTQSLVNIKGRNTIQVPIGAETYAIIVQNSTHVLYVTNFVFANKLTAIADGLTVVRPDSTVGVTTMLRIQGSLPSSQAINLSQYPLMINNQSYGALTDYTLNMSLYSYTNPQTITQQSALNLSICNISHCIYRQPSTPITPALTPIDFTSNDITITIPNLMNINSDYLLQVNFTRQISAKNFVRLLIDDRLFGALGVTTVTGYFYNDTLQRTDRFVGLAYQMGLVSSPSSNRRSINISSSVSNRSLTISSLQISFKSAAYQVSLTNSPITLQFEPPSTTYTSISNFSISGTQIIANLSSTSNKTNEIAEYQVYIQPIARAGVLTVELPEYISALFVGADASSYQDDILHNYLHIYVDGTAMNVSGTNTQAVGTSYLTGLYLLTYSPSTKKFWINIVLQAPTATPAKKNITMRLRNVTNPPDNRVMQFTISQHEYETIPTKIYGYRLLTTKMTVLRPIHVFSGIRNVTKIGARIQLALDVQIQSNSTPDYAIIRLSQTQVLVSHIDASNTSYPCQVCVDNSCDSQLFNLSTISGSNQLKLSKLQPGRHNYTISGCLINSLFSQQPVEGDQIYIGLSLPYQTAETTKLTSTYITPLISTGQISVSNFKSSSNKRAEYTTLSFQIRPENWNNCDAIHIKFGQLAYYVHNNVRCKVNGIVQPHFTINSSSLFLPVPNKSASLNIEIANIINYIKNDGFMISTLKRKARSNVTVNGKLTQSVIYNPAEYGVADQAFLQATSNGFAANNAQTRIILPDNYVSSQPKKILAINDYNIPKELPTSGLKYIFSSSYSSCSQTVKYNKTISISCVITSSGSTTFNVQLFDDKLLTVPLTSFSKSIYIYPSPKDQCSNVMCDICSDGPNGNQYCFSCREGLYSSNGQCVADCPDKSFPYNDKTCTDCSPSCATCFDLYDNSCLSCENKRLVLDSGVCTNECTQGYAFQMQYCVEEDQCTKATGCRLCSPTGFCYQCLPDFKGEPVCKYTQILPKNFFIFWMIPFILLLPIVGIITCIKVGKQTFSHMLIFLLSVIQLMSWIFVIPKMPQQAIAMIMVAFLLLRIIISIIAYQTYYNKQITQGKQQKLLGNNERQSQQKTDMQANQRKSKDQVKSEQGEQKISHKQRLIRSTAHFNSCDAYELLMNKFGRPYMNVNHYLPFFILTILNRCIVMVLLIYVMVRGAAGDLLYLPLIAILTGLFIIVTRAINSQKIRNCLSMIRG